MTARAIGVFALVLAMASPAMAGPSNSVIGGKKLKDDMVHNGGVGYPNLFYEWWNNGKKKLDWGLAGDLAYGDWGVARTGRVRTGLVSVRVSGRFIKIGLGISGILRWNLKSKERAKVTNDTAILFKPGILIAGNRASRLGFPEDSFTFGIKPEIGVPVSIDVHERVSVVTGGFIPLTVFINTNSGGFSVANQTILPLLVRLGIEIDAADKVAPWFFFDLGPGITFSDSSSDTGFAWRIGAGTAFWGVLGKNKNKSDAAEPMSAEPMSAEPIE